MPKRAEIPLSTEFEQLVAAIVAELEPSADVRWNDHIAGHRSRRLRQIDVSIRRRDPDFLGIIDAKHYARRATIDRIDALVGVMHDVQAQYGALVCSSGFSRTIFDYARRVGVSLFNVHDAESLNWSRELAIPILWTELTPVVHVRATMHLQAGDTIDTNDPLGLRVSADGGKTLLDPIATFEHYWNGPEAPRNTGIEHRFMVDEPVQALVRDKTENVALRPVLNFGLTYVVEAKTWLGHFTPSECRGLIDYLDGEAFIASHLPPEQVPAQRDESWPMVDPTRVGPTPRGTIVHALAPVVVKDARWSGVDIRYLGPDTEGLQHGTTWSRRM